MDLKTVITGLIFPLIWIIYVLKIVKIRPIKDLRLLIEKEMILVIVDRFLMYITFFLVIPVFFFFLWLQQTDLLLLAFGITVVLFVARLIVLFAILVYKIIAVKREVN